MRFGEVKTENAVGAILAHRISASTSVFHKGHYLTQPDVDTLLAANVETIWVAHLDCGDVDENTVADTIARAIMGRYFICAAASTGRVNLHAAEDGIFCVDPDRVNAINLVDPAVTLATLRPYQRVYRNQIVATIKVIPYAVSEAVVYNVMRVASEREVFSVEPFSGLSVGLVQCTSSSLKQSVLDKTRSSVEARVAVTHGVVSEEIRTPYTVLSLCEALQSLSEISDIIVIFGASAIADKEDIVPSAIKAAGGHIDYVGMPVDPGNLLVLGELAGKPVLGAPGCARSPKENGFDLVLERLMASLPVTSRDIAKMGVGGLLTDVARPHPRRSASTGRGDYSVAIAVLAAGRSSRMGQQNKLLACFDNVPLVRRSVQRAVAAGGNPVVVVTGHMAETIAEVIDDLPVQKVFNPAYATGLSSSLKCAIGTVPAACDGLMVHLADMPGITTVQMLALIEAFQATDGNTIIRATANGKRGNPVILPHSLFDEIFSLEGDVGARALIEASSLPVCEVEIGGAASIDVDTVETLEAAGGSFDFSLKQLVE